MNRKLARDLQAWEAGKLSAEQIAARHPSQADQVRRLTGLFSQMRSLADVPVPDATRGWNEVRSRMAAHVSRQPVSLLDRLSPRIQRRLVIGMAAALLAVPPVAFAANNEAVRDEVADFVLSGIDDISLSIFGNDSQAASGQSVDGSPLELEVGDGSPTPSSVKGDTAKDSVAAGGKLDSPTVAIPGTQGDSVTISNGGSSSDVSSSATNGAAGSDGGNGAAGQDGSGAPGDSKDGADADSGDGADPTPTPTPSEGTSASGNSASSPSVTSP